MGNGITGVSLLLRFYCFVPALALWLAGLPLGGVGAAILAAVSQLLYGWGAHAALGVSDRPVASSGARLPAQLLVLLGYGLLAGVLVGLPLLLSDRVGDLTFWALFGGGCTALVLVLLRFWPMLAMVWALEDDRLGGSPFETLLRARLETNALVRGDIEPVVEGLPAVSAFVAVTLLPVLLPHFGVGVGSSAWQYGWPILGVIIAPWAHGMLLLGILRDQSGGGLATPGQTRSVVEPPIEEPEAGPAADAVAAAGAGSLHVLRELAELATDFDQVVDGRTPLIAATGAPIDLRLDTLAWLLERGASSDATDGAGRTALHHAALGDDGSTIELLVARGAAVDPRDRERMTPLAVACDRGCWEAVAALIAAGADPHGVDGVVPLHLAAMAEGDDPQGVSLILAAGEAVDASGKLGRTALMGSALKGNALVANALLEAGANIDVQDDFGNTALMEAARAGANPVLERFVFWKPETEARDRPGRTALLVAVSSRRADADTIRLLLAMGADPKVRNRENRAAGDLAAAAGRWQMARALGVLVRTGQHEIPVAPAPQRQEHDGPRVIDLMLFETGEDRAWADRQFEARSRTELAAATSATPAVAAELDSPQDAPVEAPEKVPDEAPGDVPIDVTGPIPDFEAAAHGDDSLDAVVDIEFDPQKDGADAGADDSNVDGVEAQFDRETTIEVAPGETAPLPLPEVEAHEAPVAQGSRVGLETLLDAALRDDIEDMQMVIDHEPSVPQEWLVRAFEESVRGGRGIAPRWLLGKGLSADACVSAGHSLVSFAARLTPPNTEIIEILLGRGARCEDDPGVILRLCRVGDEEGSDDLDEARLPELLPLLAERGADPRALDAEGRTALHWAARLRSRQVVERLLELAIAVDQVDVSGNSALMFAVTARRTGIARILLKHGADPRLANQKGNSPLGVAMADKDQTLARMLMKSSRPEPDPAEQAGDRSAELIEAAAVGNLGRIKRLIGAGVALDLRDAQGCTALLRAAGEGHVTVVDALLNAGADATLAAGNGTTPLGAAVLGNHMHVAKVLCDRGVPADQRQQHGITPLILASARWYPRIVSTLLRSEADPNARDNTETTSLMAAVQNAQESDELDAGVATVKFLLKAGADVNAANDEGQTALMLLYGVRAREGAPTPEANVLRMASALLEAGAELDRQDVSGWSALHAAAAHGFHGAAALLLDAGASRRLRDINGLSPVDLAMERSHEELVDLFIRSG